MTGRSLSQRTANTKLAQPKARSFTEWLASPSLYPTDERLLGSDVIESRVYGFNGSVFELRTDVSEYRFFCGKEGNLRPEWPKLKHSLLGMSKNNPGRVRGVRFIRTIGELPIWLDNGPRDFNLRTKLPRNAEILCVVERRPDGFQALDEILETGLQNSEFKELAEFIATLPALRIAHESSHVVSTSVPSEELPYLLALRAEFLGLAANISSSFSGRIVRQYFKDGTSNWAIDGEHGMAREQVMFELRDKFGAQFSDILKRCAPDALNSRLIALAGYRAVVSRQSYYSARRLRTALSELYLGPLMQDISIILAGGTNELAEELSQLLETDCLVAEPYQESYEIFSRINDAASPVLYVPEPDGLLLVELLHKIKKAGKKPILVQESGCNFGGIIDIPAGRSTADQAVKVLRGISALLRPQL